MATPDAFLVNWVKTTYSMEMALVPMLEKQRVTVQDDPELRQTIDNHLEQTWQHVELLRGRLEMMGQPYAAIKPANPITEAFGETDGDGLVRAQEAELIDYVTEAFESASYRALRTLALELGDHETSRVCDEILRDEMSMAATLDRRLSGRADAGQTPERPIHERDERVAGDEGVRLARAVFEALNAHDLDRLEQDFATGFKMEAPGLPREVNREHNRAYLQAYMTAFPDLHFDEGRIIAADDYVSVDWVGSGTQNGPLTLPDGRTMPATGKQARVNGNTTFGFVDGKISRARVLFDTGDLLRQLGLLPGSATNTAGGHSRDIVHIELPASDPRIAADFYATMFGWDFETTGEPFYYTSFKAGNLGGGFADVSDVYAVGGAVLYVDSKDIESDLRRVGKLGGQTIVPKTEIPGMGWYAIFADPTGNHLGLFCS